MARSDAHGKLTLEDIASNEVALEPDTPRGHKVKARNSTVPAMLAALGLSLVVFTTSAYMAAAEEVSELRTQYTNTRADYESISDKLDRARTEGATLLVNCASSVDDPHLCEILDEAVINAEQVDITDPGKIDPYEAGRVQLRTAIGQLEAINVEADPAYEALEAACKPIHSNTAEKTRDDFAGALKSGTDLVARGRELVTSTEGKVSNQALRTAVSSAADALDATLNEARAADNGTLRDYTSVTLSLNGRIAELRKAIETLEDDNKAWLLDQKVKDAEAKASAAVEAQQQAEAEKAEAEAAASAAATASANAAAEAERARRAAANGGIQSGGQDGSGSDGAGGSSAYSQN